eukprot:193881-Chlamydomonas_euryale.AAC.1
MPSARLPTWSLGTRTPKRTAATSCACCRSTTRAWTSATGDATSSRSATLSGYALGSGGGDKPTTSKVTKVHFGGGGR